MINNLLLTNEIFFDTYKNIPINHIPVIGSHDSASYNSTNNSTNKSINNSTNKSKKMCEYYPHIKCMKVNKKLRNSVSVIQTQEIDLQSQLEIGVRAIDLYVTYDVKKCDFFFSHTSKKSSKNASDLLYQIKSYFENNKYGYLIMIIRPDVQHIDTFTCDKNTTLKTMLYDILGDIFISNIGDSFPTLFECFEKNQHILCAFPDEKIEIDNNWKWGGEFFQNLNHSCDSCEACKIYEDNVFYNHIKYNIKNNIKHNTKDKLISHVSLGSLGSLELNENKKNIKRLISGKKKEMNTIITNRKKQQNEIFERLYNDAQNEYFPITGITIWWLDFVDNTNWTYDWD